MSTTDTVSRLRYAINDAAAAMRQLLEEGGRAALAEFLNDDAPALVNILNMAEDTVLDLEPTARTIKRLLSEATSPLPGQAPAIECAVVLRHFPAPLQGSLSETPNGGLRFLSPSHPSDPRRANLARGQVLMIEQFFDYQDVVAIGLVRIVDVESPSVIVTSS